MGEALLTQTIRELYERAPVPYVTVDGKGVIQALNRRATDLLQIERHRAVGFPFRSFVSQADRGDLAAHLERFRADGRAACELTLRTLTGVEIPVRLESVPGTAEPALCWTAVFDLSAQRRAQVEHARLEAAEKAAREGNVAKDRFIAALSHELRAPLAPLLAVLPSLEGDAARSPQKLAKLAALIKRNVLRESRLIDDLLDVSRIASGKVALRREPTDLHGIARESLELVAPEAVARRQALAVELEASRHRVDGDAGRLRQVFTNLLKNAIKFTPEGGHITLRSWNRDDFVVVEVSDDGRGIEPHALSRIFETFEQGDGAPAAGGLGLGLAISRGMVELHGGKISSHSPGPGMGSRFLVELPAFGAATVSATGAPAPARARRPPKRAARGEILVIEDEPDLADTLIAVLESEGYRARAVNTASAALAMDLERVGIVISDLGLPDLDGRVLIEQLKAKRDLKAIALSGYGTEADVQASEEAGFDQHLTKPVEMEALLGAIDRVCSV